MSKTVIFCLCFFLFLSRLSVGNPPPAAENTINLTFRVLGWQPYEAMGIKYSEQVSKEQIQADIAALAAAHGWKYAERTPEIKYEKGKKITWQHGTLSEKGHLKTDFKLNFQVLREQFPYADNIIIHILGQNGFTYKDTFASNGDVINQKWRSQFPYEKKSTGHMILGARPIYRIQYTLHLKRLPENMTLPILKTSASFSKGQFIKELPFIVFTILLPGITAYLFLRRGVSRNERGKVKVKPLQFFIVYLQLHIVVALPVHFGYVWLCAMMFDSTLWGYLLGVVPVTLIAVMFLLRVLHYYEKTTRQTTWSFRENFLTNLRMMVLGTPVLLFPICFLATQKIFPNLSSLFFLLSLLAQYAILTALFACVVPLVLRSIWKGKPLEDEKLCQRLQQLADKVGIDYRNIVLLKTKSSKLANAWVAGILPKWRSVFLTDYLLENLSFDEIETIFAHELGHLKHRHLLKQVAWVVLGFCGQLVLIKLGLSVFSFLTSIPSWLYWLLFLCVNFSVIFFLVQFGLMRFWRRMEFEADAYAVQLTQQPTVFLQALRKLIELNDAPEDLDTFNEMLSTHPNFTARADAIEKL